MIGMRRRRRSLVSRVALIAAAGGVVAIAIALVVDAWLGDPWLAAGIAIAVALPMTISAVRRALAPMTAMFQIGRAHV